MTIPFRRYHLDAPDVHNPLVALSDPFERIMSLAFVQSFAMSLLVFPWNLSHEHNALPPIVSLLECRNLVTVAVWAVVLLLVWFATASTACARNVARRWRLLFFLGWAVVSYLPASHVFLRVGFVLAERQLLLPSAGAVLLLGEAMRAALEHLATTAPTHGPESSISSLEKKKSSNNDNDKMVDKLQESAQETTGTVFRTRRVVVLGIAMVGMVMWGCRTWIRNWDWANDRGILESCVKMYPEHNFMAWYGLGAVEMYAQNLTQAEHYLLLAAEEEPEIAEPRMLLSQLYLQYPGFSGPSSHHKALYQLSKIIDMYSIRRESWTDYGYLLLLLLHSPPLPRGLLEPSLTEEAASLPHLSHRGSGTLFPNSSLLASDEERWYEAEYFIIAGAKSTALPPRHRTRGVVHSNAACMRLLSPTSRFGNVRHAMEEAKAAARIVHPSVHVAAHNLAVILAINGNIPTAVSYLQVRTYSFFDHGNALGSCHAFLSHARVGVGRCRRRSMWPSRLESEHGPINY